MGKARLSWAVIALGSALAACGPGTAKIPDGSWASVIAVPGGDFNGDWTLVLEPGGRYRIALDGQTTVSGHYDSGEAGVVTFTDESGPMMCGAGGASGTYRWSLEGGRLSLAPQSDDCLGRRGILGQQAFTRKAARLQE